MKLHPRLNPSRFFRSRNSIPLEDLKPVECANCRHEFKGHFCPNCGQEVAELNRPFGFVIYDFLGNFFAFDTRFFRTFKYLLIRPGFLTSEFFQGRRVRYSPPFRNFVFLSFVLFILIQVLSERLLDQASDERTISATVKIDIDSDELSDPQVSEKSLFSNIQGPDSLSMIAKPAQANDSINAIDPDLDLDFQIAGAKNIREYLLQLAEQYENKLETTTDPILREKYISYIVMCRAPEMVISKILKYLSWAFFILLPVFALILKLFYIRRHHLYIKHLIFSIHFHSFLFFILIIIMSLKLLFDYGISTISGILLLTIPVYFMVAMRKFYGQGFGKIILKFVGISFIYNLFLWSAVLFAFAHSLGFV